MSSMYLLGSLTLALSFIAVLLVDIDWAHVQPSMGCKYLDVVLPQKTNVINLSCFQPGQYFAIINVSTSFIGVCRTSS